MLFEVAIAMIVKVVVTLLTESCLIINTELSSLVLTVMNSLAFVRVLLDVGFNFNLSGNFVEDVDLVLIKNLVHVLVLTRFFWLIL